MPIFSTLFAIRVDKRHRFCMIEWACCCCRIVRAMHVSPCHRPWLHAWPLVGHLSLHPCAHFVITLADRYSLVAIEIRFPFLFYSATFMRQSDNPIVWGSRVHAYMELHIYTNNDQQCVMHTILYSEILNVGSPYKLKRISVPFIPKVNLMIVGGKVHGLKRR